MTSTVQISNHPHFEISITSDSDLTVRVWEYEDMRASPGQKPPVKSTTDFAVKKDVFRANSPFFDTMFGSRFRESDASLVELKENSWIHTIALEIWFRRFHEVAMTEVCMTADREAIWSLVRAGDEFGLKREPLIQWFREWFDKNVKGKNLGSRLGKDGGTIAQEMLYPCWAFDYAPGFLAATKWLVYNTEKHIMERNPSKHRNFDLPPCVIQQLNSARGRLKSVLHDELWDPIEGPLKAAECNCKEKTLFLYQKTLLNIDVWPLERTFSQTSVAQILSRLRTFKYTSDHKSCNKCNIACESVVEDAIIKVTNYFDGLCLKCMDKTNPKTASSDSPYWTHHHQKSWDLNCRKIGVKHGEPSWYFSYMGQEPFKDAREAWYEDLRCLRELDLSP